MYTSTGKMSIEAITSWARLIHQTVNTAQLGTCVLAISKAGYSEDI